MEKNNNKNLLLQRITQNVARYQSPIPYRKDAADFLQHLLDFLFPVNQHDSSVSLWRYLNQKFGELRFSLNDLLEQVAIKDEKNIEILTDSILSQLPALLDSLLLDAEMIFENDPASVSLEEVVAAYPGFRAIVIYRFSHLLVKFNVNLLPRIFSEIAHSQTGIDIHPKAIIGHSFFIDHGTGIVIGETAEIGNNVKLYQGVTLGAIYVCKSLAGKKRHPTIENNVVVYANSTILGGTTVVGEHSVIGGNTWIIKSVPPGSQVFYQGKNLIRMPSTSQPVLIEA